MIKLVSIDIDGTLLTSKHSILKSSFEALKFLHEKGVHVVLNSGRSLPEMKAILDVLPMIEYVVCGNGSTVYEVKTKKRLYEQTIDAKIVVDMYEEIKDLDHMLEFYDNAVIYAFDEPVERLVQFGFGAYIQYLEETRTLVDNVPDLLKTLDKIEKANFSFETAQIQQEALKRLKKYPVSLASSFLNNIEVSGLNVNKASGLAFLSQYLDIPSKQMLAIGDGGNDYEMLDYVGIGVAMENAKSDLKEMADDITQDCDHDGVANAIYKFIK